MLEEQDRSSHRNGRAQKAGYVRRSTGIHAEAGTVREIDSPLWL